MESQILEELILSKYLLIGILFTTAVPMILMVLTRLLGIRLSTESRGDSYRRVEWYRVYSTVPMHVLPNGFMRMRHDGFMASCHRKAKQVWIKGLLNIEPSSDVTDVIGQIASVVRAITGLYPGLHVTGAICE